MPRASSRAPASTVTPRVPSWRAVSRPIPLLAPVIRAIVVVMPPTLVTRQRSRERPFVPGTGSTTHRAPGRSENEGHELEPPHRAGRVPAGPARQAGLPEAGTPGRRRTPGLRRQEVAQLAGLSVDYYIRLEQARGPHPSRQVL